MVTKGYGFTVDDIDWSSPADLKPYEKAKVMEENISDARNWQLGQYFAEAIGTMFKGKYPKKPLFQLEDENGANGNAESREEVAVFEMKQRINLLKRSGLPDSPM